VVVFLFSEIVFPHLPYLARGSWYPLGINEQRLKTILAAISKLEFLPLMLTSVIGAVNMIACWIISYALLRENPADDVLANVPIDLGASREYQTDEISNRESLRPAESGLPRRSSDDDFSFLSDHIAEEDDHDGHLFLVPPTFSGDGGSISEEDNSSAGGLIKGRGFRKGGGILKVVGVDDKGSKDDDSSESGKSKKVNRTNRVRFS